MDQDTLHQLLVAKLNIVWLCKSTTLHTFWYTVGDLNNQYMMEQMLVYKDNP